MNPIANEARLAIKIAMKREKPVSFMMSGGVIAFERINSCDDHTAAPDSGVVHLRGRLIVPKNSAFHPDLDSWVCLDLNRVEAVIDRDLPRE